MTINFTTKKIFVFSSAIISILATNIAIASASLFVKDQISEAHSLDMRSQSIPTIYGGCLSSLKWEKGSNFYESQPSLSVGECSSSNGDISLISGSNSMAEVTLTGYYVSSSDTSGVNLYSDCNWSFEDTGTLGPWLSNGVHIPSSGNLICTNGDGTSNISVSWSSTNNAGQITLQD